MNERPLTNWSTKDLDAALPNVSYDTRMMIVEELALRVTEASRRVDTMYFSLATLTDEELRELDSLELVGTWRGLVSDELWLRGEIKEGRSPMNEAQYLGIYNLVQDYRTDAYNPALPQHRREFSRMRMNEWQAVLDSSYIV